MALASIVVFRVASPPAGQAPSCNPWKIQPQTVKTYERKKIEHVKESCGQVPQSKLFLAVNYLRHPEAGARFCCRDPQVAGDVQADSFSVEQ